MNTTVISTVGECESPSCAAFGRRLYHQLKEYNPCSVLSVPLFTEGYLGQHRTLRKRADRAERRGYVFGTANMRNYADDMYAINTSMEERQGRRMAEPYWTGPTDTRLPDFDCERHCIIRYGVFNPEGDRLLAYLELYRSNSLRLVSRVLGHGDYLEDEIMWLLFRGTILAQHVYGGQVVYNRHDSGTDGLRWFKERVGFQSMRVAWAL